MAKMDKIELGERIANERKAKGISIRAMAEKANTSTRAVQAVEKGWYNVGIDTYLALADRLGQQIVLQSK